MSDKLTPDQRELADYMSELSEVAYYAGWIRFDGNGEVSIVPIAEWSQTRYDPMRAISGCSQL